MSRAIKYLFSFRCVALLCALFFMQQSNAQTVPVYGDSTRLSKLKNGAGNELIVENSTKNIAGALVNYANGRTHFKLVLDTVFSFNDTILRFRFTDGSTKDVVTHGSGAVTVETDPVATAKTITITGSSDVPVTGGTQTIGANPSYTIGSVNWANGYPTYDLRYASLLNSDFIASGGIVTWISGYTYNVSPAVYYINGVRYTSPSTNITLSAADATFDRIDVFALTTSGTAVAITGTPTSNPEKPDIDNNTQIEASFAVVEAATTQPTINQEWIYRENADWTTAVSNASINPNSTNSPFAGSKDVEGTAVANTHNITYTRSTSLNISTFSNAVLSFEIKSKASWSTNKKFTLQWFNGTTAVGNAIPFGDQSYGFVSSSTSSYFLVSIPLKDFGALSTVTKLRMQAANTSGTFGFFIDNIQIQSVTQTGTTGIQTVLGTSPINVTTSGNTATISLNNSGITPGTYNNVTLDAHGIATGGSNVSYLTGNQSITISGDATGTGTTSIPLTLATVNSSPATYGSASQSLTGTVNGKGLITSLSAQNIQIAESQVTNLTTDLSGKQASLTGSQGDMIYFSATNALASLAKSTTAHQFISSDGTSNNPLYETINSDWITQGSTNKFYTDALARAAISLTTTGTSGASTYNSSTGVLNVPQYSGGGSGSPGGSNTQLQYNNSGAFGGTSGATTDGTNIFIPTLNGSSASGGNLTLKSTSNATKGKIFLGAANSAYDEVNTRLGIGTTSPSYGLQISNADAIQAQYLATGITTGTTSGFLLSTSKGSLGWNLRFQTNQDNGWFEMADNAGAINRRWHGKDDLMASDGIFGWSSETNYATAGVGARDLGLSRSAANTLKVTNGSSGLGSLQTGALTSTTANGMVANFITTGSVNGTIAGFALITNNNGGGSGYNLRFQTNQGNGWFEMADNAGNIQRRWNAHDDLMASDGIFGWSSQTTFATAGTGARDLGFKTFRCKYYSDHKRFNRPWQITGTCIGCRHSNSSNGTLKIYIRNEFNNT
jgi:hypothetical protein